MANPVGAPRSICPPPTDMIALGEEMIQWISENKPLHLSQFYTIHKGYTYNQWKAFILKAEFHPYYEKALKMVGVQYLDKESRIRDSISQRWQRVYFKDLKEEEDETAQFNANLKAQSIPETEKDQQDKETLFDSIIAYQKRQIDLTRKRIDNKSALDAGPDKA